MEEDWKTTSFVLKYRRGKKTEQFRPVPLPDQASHELPSMQEHFSQIPHFVTDSLTFVLVVISGQVDNPV